MGIKAPRQVNSQMPKIVQRYGSHKTPRPRNPYIYYNHIRNKDLKGELFKKKDIFLKAVISKTWPSRVNSHNLYKPYSPPSP
jgi:hypothetical protein